MSEDIKTLYKVVDKLEQRIKTNEDKSMHLVMI